MLAQMPLPWTLDTLWVLTQLAVQISFIAVIVLAVTAICALAITGLFHD